MADTPAFEYPEGFELWPQSVQQEWLEGYHALYFPKLRWWEKPETLDESSGPRPKQLPPDHPRHTELDLQGYHCGCSIRHPEEDRGKVLTCGCGGNPEWRTLLLLTGRGWGKTLCGANWVLEMALAKPDIHIGVCAPTYDLARSICFEGQSGIIAEARRNNIEIPDYNKNRLEVRLQTGSKIRGFSAEKPDSIRGENLSYCWFDELAMIRYFSFYHEGLQPALRKGENPRLLITTTPKRVRLLRDLLADAENEAETGVHVTRGFTAENPHYAKRQREALERKYAGTYLLKQELEGELIGDVDGALFPLEMFNEFRVFPGKDTLPQWRRVVVAIDPATTSKESSDETGICVAAEGDDGDFYILEDCSGRYAPDQQMHVVAEAFYRHSADCVVGEVNMTGDYMRALLNTVDDGANIPLRTVHGMRGKVARAQGPSSLFFQGRIHMVGDNFGELEQQLSAMAEGDDRSRMKDDRADSCLAEGTPVLTPAGEVPIEAIAPGDLVWTRAGWKPVTAARCTQRNAEVITILLSDGRELTGTGDHRIWTENDGWKRLDTLVWGDILSGWNLPKSSSIKDTLTGVTRIVRAAVIGSTTSAAFHGASGISIATSGSTRIRARKSRKAGTFTTRTRTRSTTTRPTWNFSRQPSTASFTPVTSPGRKRTFSHTLTAFVPSLRSGTVPKRAGRGTSSTASVLGRTGSPRSRKPARSAAQSSPHGRMTRGTARAAASTGRLSSDCGSRLPVSSAGLSTRRTARRAARPVLLHVAGSFARSERRDVYDLTVADVHEFTASGVIVHNCIWALIHLAGSNQGDWGSVYGFIDCGGCGARVNYDKDKACGNCGKPVTPPTPKHAGGRPSREPWSSAYRRECPNGHTYPLHHKSCPECTMNPEEYLARALAAQQGGGGWHTYSGKNWMAGRHF